MNRISQALEDLHYECQSLLDLAVSILLPLTSPPEEATATSLSEPSPSTLQSLPSAISQAREILSSVDQLTAFADAEQAAALASAGQLTGGTDVSLCAYPLPESLRGVSGLGCIRLPLTPSNLYALNLKPYTLI